MNIDPKVHLFAPGYLIHSHTFSSAASCIHVGFATYHSLFFSETVETAHTYLDTAGLKVRFLAKSLREGSGCYQCKMKSMDGWSRSSPAESVSACLKNELLYGASEQTQKSTSHLAYKAVVYIQFDISVTGRSGCTPIHRNWFGHWSVIWPGQDVVIKHGCGRAVVTIPHSCNLSVTY